jgi:hypothetical protein
MKRLFTGAAVVLGVLWSLFAWGAYALVEWAGGFASANADVVTGHPETVVLLSQAAGLLTSLGLAGVVVVWLIGLAVLLLIPVAARLLGGSRPLPRS